MSSTAANAPPAAVIDMSELSTVAGRSMFASALWPRASNPTASIALSKRRVKLRSGRSGLVTFSKLPMSVSNRTEPFGMSRASRAISASISALDSPKAALTASAGAKLEPSGTRDCAI